MGTRIVKPTFGDECANWAIPAETPTQIYGMIWDVKKGDKPGAVDPPNERVFTLKQHDVDPCKWLHDGSPDDWSMDFTNDEHGGWLVVNHIPPDLNNYFYGFLPPSPYPMLAVIENLSSTPIDRWGYDGYGFVYWMEGLLPIVIAFGLDHVDDLMLEIFPISDTDFVIKLCSITLGMNVKIKISR